MNSIRKFQELLFFSVPVILVDQLTKTLVRRNLAPGESWAPIPGVQRFIRVLNFENPGTAFGLFGEESNNWIVWLSFVALIVFLFYLPRIPAADRYMRISFALLVGGITGNLIDRLLQGYVTDIITVLVPNVFNIADLANLAGVVILVIGYLEEGENHQKVDETKKENAVK